MLLILSAGLMLFTCSGFASGPSEQNKNGSGYHAKYHATGGTLNEEVTLLVMNHTDFGALSYVQEAEKPTQYSKIEPSSILRIDRGFAFHRGSGSGYRYNKNSSVNKAVTFHCRTENC